MTATIRKQKIRKRPSTGANAGAWLVARVRQRLARSGGSGVARRRERKIPLVSVFAVAILAIGGVAVVLTSSPGTSALSRGGLALPKDPQLEALLNSYSLGLKTAPALAGGGAPERLQGPKPLKMSSYTVRPGDTISGIAQSHGISDETLISFNDISDVRFLRPGQELQIPSMDGILYQVRRGDSLGGIASAHQVKLAAVLDANNIANSTIYAGQQLFLPHAHMNSFTYRKALGTLFIYPTVGMLTSPFGMRPDPFTGVYMFHNGIDLANAIGTPVDAAMDGRVVYLGVNRGYGQYILLDHGGGYQTLYGHLSKWIAHMGEYVRAGQEIAEMGDTGYSTGPHLHFTIYKDSVPVNPLNYLGSR